MEPLTPQQQLVCTALGLTSLPETKEDLDAALLKLESLELNALTNIAPSLPKPPSMKSGTYKSDAVSKCSCNYSCNYR